MKRKKIYIKPIIERVNLDRELILLSTTEGTPPDPPGPEKAGAKSVSNSFDKSSLKENPFAK